MKALVDSDVCVYRVAWASEDVDENIARWRMNEMLNQIRDTLKATEVSCYLTSTDKSNYRIALFPDYKANRKQPKPKHYLAMRDHLIQNWDAEVIYGMEADDALGINQTSTTCICTNDKDLNQIPGWHYNFTNGRLFNMAPIEALRCFYEQTLVGDKGDNIEGCPGIGEVKAPRILQGCQNEEEMLQEVIKNYQMARPKDWSNRLLLAGNLLWVRRKHGQSWELQTGEVVSNKTLERFSETKESDLDLKTIDMPLLSPNSSDIIPPILI